MLIQRAAILAGRVVDMRTDDRIVEVADTLTPRTGEVVLDAAGGLVIPGLHDHHVHLLSAAAAMTSVQVGPPQVVDRDQLAGAVSAATPDDAGWIRAVGYHDSVAGPLDRAVLDTISVDVPLRVAHRSGGLWTVNSAGLARLGIPEHADGCLRRSETSLFDALPRARPSLRPLSDRLVAHGVTGVTDATPDQTADDVEALAVACRTGELRQHLHCMAPADVTATAGLTLGPVKVILEDDDLDLDRLEKWIARCHARDCAVAIHAVTVAQLVVAIAALRSAGVHPLDRIEHAAMVPDDCVGELADLGVTVVTQPNFIAERGDQYLEDVPIDDHRLLWRLASLVRGGVGVALSTDMPYGAGDPWATMRAAVRRTTGSGIAIGTDEIVSARAALTLFLGHPERPARPRGIRSGQPGDLVVLSAPPDEALRALDAGMVAATIIGGALQ